MGLFNFINYDKEGPGIEKNAPKKKAFFLFFEMFFRNFWKFMTTNVFYCLISSLIVTNGLAAAGITHVARNTARDKHSFGLSDFFETIKKNFKQSLIVGILNVIIFAFLFAEFFFFYFYTKGVLGYIGIGVTLTGLLIFTVMNFYIWTLMITFNYTLKQLYMNSFRFCFINMKRNLVCLLSHAAVYAVLIGLLFLIPNYWLTVLLIEILLYILIYPGFKYLLIQFCVFPAIKKFIIDPYYELHPDDDLQLRHDLGLDEEDIAEEDEEEAEEEEEEESDFTFDD